MMKRLEILLLAVLTTSLVVHAEGSFSGDLMIVRVDERNQRVLVAPAAAFVQSATSAREYVDRLSREIAVRYPAWSDAWVASFCDNPRLAAYKTEQSVLEAVKSGAWSSVYLAEYDNATRKFVWSPLDPDKVRHVVFEVAK